MSAPVVMIEGKCEVTTKNDLPNSNLSLPTNVKLTTLTRKPHAVKKNKGKQICDDEQAIKDKQNATPENCLATLDIFAGCGGLSEGLQLSGASRQNGQLNMKNLPGKRLVKIIQRQRYLWRTTM